MLRGRAWRGRLTLERSEESGFICLFVWVRVREVTSDDEHLGSGQAQGSGLQTPFATHAHVQHRLGQHATHLIRTVPTITAAHTHTNTHTSTHTKSSQANIRYK